jgi:hypothetical protein
LENQKSPALVVVNSVGLITDKSGLVCAGGQKPTSGGKSIYDMINQIPDEIHSVPGSILGQIRKKETDQRNTAISVVVTNKKMKFHELNRLAIQVHSSMGRAIQPFGTANDADVLFAVSTDEIEDDTHPTDFGVIASDVMWDAVLSSIPDVPDHPADLIKSNADTALSNAAGEYSFAQDIKINISSDSDHQLSIQNMSELDFFGIKKGENYTMSMADSGMYTGASLFFPELAFSRQDEQRVVLINPGPWQQIGRKLQ